MSKRSIIPFVVLLLMVVSLFAGFEQVQSQDVLETYLPLVFTPKIPDWIGPDGGTIATLVVDPSNPEILYAGTWGGGVFKSVDYGATWSLARGGLESAEIMSIAVDPVRSNILFAGSYKDKLYKSTDAGETWKPSSNGLQPGVVVYDIAIDPTKPDRIYLATRGVSSEGLPPWNGVLYKSEDGGASWKAVKTDVGGEDQQDWAYNLAIHPKQPNLVYAAYHEYGPFRSEDYGETWKPINEGITDKSGRAIALDPKVTGDATAYFGVWHRSGLFKTIDGGDNWTELGGGTLGVKIKSIAIDPLLTSNVYLGTFTHGVMKSINSGSSWGLSGLYGTEIYKVLVHPENNQTLFAGTASDGIYKSTTAAASWYHSQVGLRASSTTALVDSPVTGSMYAATYGGGVFQMEDGSQTWAGFNAGLPEKFINHLVIHPGRPNVFFALTDHSGLYTIDINSGSTWSPSRGGLPDMETLTADSGAARPFAPLGLEEHLLEQEETEENTVLASTYSPLLSMAFAPSNHNVVYLGTGGSGVFKSTNGGAYWHYIGMEGQDNANIVVDPKNENMVYLGSLYTMDDNLYSRFSISFDGGKTWKHHYLPGTMPIYTLSTIPLPGCNVLAGSGNGLYCFNLQNGWRLIGLQGKEVRALSVNPRQPNIIYAGTTDGAFSSYDQGVNWYPGPNELKGVTVQDISFSPDNPQYVYYSTVGNGVLRVQIGR